MPCLSVTSFPGFGLGALALSPLHFCVPFQVAALLEERLNQGVNFLLSGEIDHWKKDYKFGFGLTVGE